VLTIARRLAYDAEDCLTGAYASRHLRDIARLLSQPEFTTEYQQGRLYSLLRHVTELTPFYSSYRGAGRLSDLPVVTKAAIKDDPEEFTSRGNDKVVRVFTSGSYGTPMTFSLSPQKARRRRAEAVYFNSLAGYRVGMPYAVVNALAFPRHNHWKTLLRNELVLNVPDLSHAQLQQACNRLVAGGIQLVIGWPSVLAPLASYATTEGVTFPRVRGVISMGEILTTEYRQAIEQGFGCPVLDRYALNEFGVVAHQLSPDGAYRVNTAGYIVELLNIHDDFPARPGELGRIVVTDLYSHAMPLIRYETGDLGMAWQPAASSLVWLDSIEGRSYHTLRTDAGDRMPGLRLLDAIRKTEKHKMAQYQFCVTDEKSVEARIVPRGTLDTTAIIDDIKRVLGQNMEVRVVPVEVISSLPSGKRPMIVYGPKEASL
jgi:phenylacetate-CoA ligase